MLKFARFAAPALLALAVAAPAAAAGHGSGGISDGTAFYANGHAYRTVGTPTDFSNTGAPDLAYDTIYAFPAGTQLNVTSGAPGDPDFNGGRWMVTPIMFTDYNAAVTAFGGSNQLFDSDTEVQSALDAGAAWLGDPIQYFECPVIPLPGNVR